MHVEANLQKTSAPRATSGSDQQLSALLASITGCILPLATPPSLKRLMPAGVVEGGGWGGGACENCYQTCARHIHVTTEAGVSTIKHLNVAIKYGNISL